ncbi:tol-pal system protein YbgF [Actibacterium sp. 188UL27-1]|uniref:tol-pal system protein YbgF n=1 Tax=Actibacterium sp. 188UL27-1 TaxID=2786961 RepID=UPI001959DB48|nr:tol-pal system protein YbgF [Actibacterium sp. 188UL27-1]MBM7068228.1 tol-pal system protein YbgF [Actibacterium sp. 188UL27-1]
MLNASRLSHSIRALLVTAALLAPLPLAAQDTQTLADIKQELTVLSVEMQKLQRELSTTGSPNVPTLAGSALDRLTAMESQLQRLTARTEELQSRIDRVVADGTNRIGDLEFRLTELAGGDLSKLGATEPLGGGAGAAPTAITPAPQPGQNNGGPQLAASEQLDFDRAKEALDQGSFRSAADLFAAFAQAYPGGPLTGQAHFYRGEALTELGDTAPAARAYLESFSGSPDGALAPSALYKLGTTLEELGQVDEACVTLGEVATRFPGTDVAFDADADRLALGCS